MHGRFFSLWTLAGIIIVIGIVMTARHFDVAVLLRSTLAWVGGLGPLAPIFFILLYVMSAVLLIPGSILTISAGVLFGLGYGIVYVLIGATLGATCAFLTGRYIARDWVARKLQNNPKFVEIDRAVAHEGWKIVGLTRLSPVFPFNLSNYALGLTSISLRDYFFASMFGMIPGIVVYVYIGTLAGDIAKIGEGAAKPVAGQWAIEIVGFLATIVLAFYIARLARKALRQKSIEQG